MHADELRLRWPRAARLGFAAFLALWCVGLVAISRTGTDGGGVLWRLLPVAMLAFGVVSGVRTLRLEVHARADELMVRNPWRTHRIARSDIAGFSTSRYARVGHERAYADLRDGGDIRLVVLDPLPPPLPGRATERALDRLEAWRTGTEAG